MLAPAMRTILREIDRIGRSGAPRSHWQGVLGEGFEKWSSLLNPRGIAATIQDPDFPEEVLDLEWTSHEHFTGYSQSFPAHRAPLRIPRGDCVILAPNLCAISSFLSEALRFDKIENPRWSDNCFHQIGTLKSIKCDTRFVYLFIPDSRPREAMMQAGISNVPGGIVLLPISRGYTPDLKILADRHNVSIRVLDTKCGLDSLPITHAANSVRRSRKSVRPPIFNPKKHWEWKDLTIEIRKDGLHFFIHGESHFGTWTDLRMRPLTKGSTNETIALLGDLANGKRLTQRRTDVNSRKKISDARLLLTSLIPISTGDPFEKFLDGWGAKFRVDGSSAKHAVSRLERHDKDRIVRPDQPHNVFEYPDSGFTTKHY